MPTIEALVNGQSVLNPALKMLKNSTGSTESFVVPANTLANTNDALLCFCGWSGGSAGSPATNQPRLTFGGQELWSAPGTTTRPTAMTVLLHRFGTHTVLVWAFGGIHATSGEHYASSNPGWTAGSPNFVGSFALPGGGWADPQSIILDFVTPASTACQLTVLKLSAPS